MYINTISKLKFLIFISILFNPIISTSYANGVLCWDRDVRMAMASFTNHQNPKAAAETWFPKYIEIKKTKVRWGSNQNSLNGSARNVGKKITSAAIQRNGYTFRFKLNEESTKAFVTMIPPGQYISIPPAKYNKCKIIQDNVKTVTKPTKVKKSYLQRCSLTPAKLKNIQTFINDTDIIINKRDTLTSEINKLKSNLEQIQYSPDTMSSLQNKFKLLTDISIKHKQKDTILQNILNINLLNEYNVRY